MKTKVDPSQAAKLLDFIKKNLSEKITERLNRNSRRLAKEIGEFYYQSITGQKPTPESREEHKRFPAVSEKTEMVHRWARRKYGNFYKYMELTRGHGGEDHNDIKKIDEQIRKKRDSLEKRWTPTKERQLAELQRKREGNLSRIQKQSRDAAKRRISRDPYNDDSEATGKRVFYSKSQFQRDGFREAIEQMKAKATRPTTKIVRMSQFTNTDLKETRTSYFATGRMARGIREATQVRVTSKQGADGLPELEVHTTLDFKDRGAERAFFYMMKRDRVQPRKSLSELMDAESTAKMLERFIARQNGQP